MCTSGHVAGEGLGLCCPKPVPCRPSRGMWCCCLQPSGVQGGNGVEAVQPLPLLHRPPEVCVHQRGSDPRWFPCHLPLACQLELWVRVLLALRSKILPTLDLNHIVLVLLGGCFLCLTVTSGIPLAPNFFLLYQLFCS